MHDLTAFQRDLLYVVAGLDRPSGLDIKEELERSRDAEINTGRLYGNLDILVEKGLVHKGHLDGRTNVYSLAPRGRREIADRREWERELFGESDEAATEAVAA